MKTAYDRYSRVLSTANKEDIVTELRYGANVNRRVGFGAMDVFISKKYKEGIELVLANPEWDPNYQGPDGLYLIERAMLKSEKLALRIMAHPRFNMKARVSAGRTLAMSAVMFSMPHVFRLSQAHTKSADRDNCGKTLSQYLEKYGQPKAGRIARFRRDMEMYRKTLHLLQADHTRY